MIRREGVLRFEPMTFNHGAKLIKCGRRFQRFKSFLPGVRLAFAVGFSLAIICMAVNWTTLSRTFPLRGICSSWSSWWGTSGVSKMVTSGFSKYLLAPHMAQILTFPALMRVHFWQLHFSRLSSLFGSFKFEKNFLQDFDIIHFDCLWLSCPPTLTDGFPISEIEIEQSFFLAPEILLQNIKKDSNLQWWHWRQIQFRQKILMLYMQTFDSSWHWKDEILKMYY